MFVGKLTQFNKFYICSLDFIQYNTFMIKFILSILNFNKFFYTDVL